MSPVLGIIASGISGHLTPPYDPSGFDALASATLSASASSLSIVGIPTTYRHLQVRIVARATDAATANYLFMRVNNDTTSSNYARHILIGDGASANSYSSTGSTITNLGEIPAANATAGIFGSFVLDILDYKDTVKFKTIRSIGGDDRNGNGEVELNSILYMSTNAITSLQFTTYTAASLAQYTQVAVYGVK
jgi:hypothetical protein